MVRKPKPASERVINAGISLPPRFIEEVRDVAQAEGFASLTHLVRWLLTQWKQEVEKKWEMEEIEKEKAKASPSVPPPRKRGRPKKKENGPDDLGQVAALKRP
jgi:hypothetical protein